MIAIGIISEGTEDYATLKNILKGIANKLNVEIYIKAIRPDLSKDETDKHNNQHTIGTFQGVKNACQGVEGQREDFERFFIFRLRTSSFYHSVRYCRNRKSKL